MNSKIFITLNLLDNSILLNEGVLNALDWPRQVQLLINNDESMNIRSGRVMRTLVRMSRSSWRTPSLLSLPSRKPSNRSWTNWTVPIRPRISV